MMESGEISDIDKVRKRIGMFDHFFKSVNAQSHKFQQTRHSIHVIHDEDVLDIEYLG